MQYTPVEIRHVKLKRGLFGYRRAAVDDVLEEVADSFELVWRERADLTEKMHHLEGELARHRDLESLLRSTLTSAEKAAHELKDQAKRESEVVVAEARSEARAIVRDAAAEHERLTAEARRVRALLNSALEATEAATEPRAA